MGADDRQRGLDALRAAIDSLREENVSLRRRSRRQAEDLARLTGQLSTLERTSQRLSDRVDALDSAHVTSITTAQQQAAQFDAIRGEVSTLTSQFQAARTMASSPPTAHGLISTISRLLPAFVRAPLRHVFYSAVQVIDRENPRARAYRASRKVATRQAASLKEQRRLFKQITDAHVGEQLDFIILPIIDWHFRIQRPQHLARCLAEAGHRVFYMTTTFAPTLDQAGFNILESPSDKVFLCQLYCPEPHPTIYDARRDDAVAEYLAAGLEVLFRNFHFEQTVCVVQHPFWRQVAERLQGTLAVYDCMDHHGAFATGGSHQGEEEQLLLREADLVVTTSANLAESIARHVPNELIRNAADVAHFSGVPDKPAIQCSGPIVGYFGAISSWYDIELIEAMAERFPAWTFVLIGSTFECDIRKAQRLDNIRFTGELPYQELPEYLHAFDVCIIPFKLTDLTLCTNPVKVYEYLSAGKPVVATPMPELVRLSDYVHIAGTRDEFANKLEIAMKEVGDQELAKKRADWAKTQTWDERGRRFLQAIDRSYPKVSVVVLVYNNTDITRACLHSLEAHSHYPNLELIIVDNASTDGAQTYLRSYEESRPLRRITDCKVIFNSENLGFAGGNNVGIAATTGDVVILLNNDTYVTDGWILDLIRHFRETPDLGLVGPVTNNIGNEARIRIDYASMGDMADAARQHTRGHPRELLSVNNVAFFCVAMPRNVIEEVGLLDEEFELGFFEDDDYCNRVRRAGYRIGIAENVFVHHHLSASFDTLKQEERDALFRRNKDLYEKKWGEWKPHTYREGL